MKTKTLVIGHRGAGVGPLENTLRSFESAARLGCDGVELDVQLTADRRLVVLHDDRVDRTTNGRGAVREFTYSRLRRLDAGEGERVPTLEEVLDLARGRFFVHVELKALGTALPVARLLAKSKAFEWTAVSSFHHPMLAQVKAAQPSIRTAVVYACLPIEPVRLARAAHADGLHPEWDFVTPAFVREAHRAGLRIMPWTVDSPEVLRSFLRWGVDELCTNRPELALHERAAHAAPTARTQRR